jgi:hypothetical protein
LRARRKPDLTIAQILEWADKHFERLGRWPNKRSGAIVEAAGDTWLSVNVALNKGCRGLAAGSSLPRLLAEQRGVRNIQDLPPLTFEGILAWADAHFARTGEWPTSACEAVLDASGETWHAIDKALRMGRRSLPGGSSLARLLLEHRGVRNRKNLPPYQIDQLLRWADAHFERTGKFPTHLSGPIADAPGETWHAVHDALTRGQRGLAGGSSLARLLAEHRGHRNTQDLPDHSIARIVAWADAHRARTGAWPNRHSGPIVDAPGENWHAVNAMLHQGGRGLPGGTSLAALLAKHRRARNKASLPRLTVPQILTWVDGHRRRTGLYPIAGSGCLADSPGETWNAIDMALRSGRRGLAGGSSLARLLAKQYGVRNSADIRPLTIKQILAWADAYYQRHERWPSQGSGPIEGAAGESWQTVNAALYHGQRGLPGGSSLPKLLAQRRGVRNRTSAPRLTVE